MEKKETKQATERLLRLNQVLARVPISRATWYAGIRDGRFPPPVKLGARISAWREGDVLVLLDRGTG